MASRRSLVLTMCAVAVNVAAYTQSSAQDHCQPFLASVGGAHTLVTYAARNAEYCDGSVFEPNAGYGELRVIGVTAGQIQGDPQLAPLALTVLRSRDGAPLSGGMRLQGIARERKVNYRLDGGMPPQGPIRIGQESAMVRMTPRLRAEEVAWAAWTDSTEQGRTYYPVVLEGAPGQQIEILVRPTIRSAYVRYAITDAGGGTIAPDATAKEGVAPGEPVAIPVPFGSPSSVIVNISAVGNGGRTQAVAVRLVRPAVTTR